MPFPSTNGSDLATALGAAIRLASAVKQQCQAVRSQVTAGSVRSTDIIELSTFMADALDRFTIIGNLSGMAQYAKDQFNDQNYNIGVEFTSLLTAIDTLRDWIRTNFPKSANGHLEEKTFDANGRYVVSSITTGLTAFGTNLDAVISAVA